MRSLNFADGFESASEPTQGNLTSNALKVFASDAAYVADKGSAASQGDIYSNSTTDKIRFYNDAGWVDVVLEDTSGNVTLDGNLTVTGDLTINGTTTTVNTSTLEVEDKNITVNNGGDDSTSEGAGITVERTGTSGAIIYAAAATSKFKVGALGSEVEVADISSVQTFTNKTLTAPTLTTPSTEVVTLDGQASTPSTPSSGYYKAYVKDSTGKLTILNSAGTETAVGGGSSGINLIGDGSDAEAGTTGWSTFADAASSRPVDGTGGSANITWTTSSTTPLYGANSFVFTKDAVNRQGEGVSYAFTVSPAHQAKVLQISFDYIVGSGTFVAGSSGVDSDLIAYIYDVTNSTLIEPSSFKLLSNSTTIADRFNATFQTSATGTSYRLLLFCATTSASAYTLKFDNISVSPSNYIYGTSMTDFANVTAVAGDFTGFGTPTSMEYESRRVGDSLEIRGKFVSGTATATEGRVALRYRGATVTAASTDKIASIKIVGKAVRSSVAAVDFVVLAAPNTSYVTFGIQDGSRGGSGSQNGDQLIASGATFTFFASVPILGWSSSSQTSDSADTRVITARAYRSGNQSVSTAAETDIVFNVTSFDDVGGFNTSTGVYTVQVPGKYRVKTSLYISSAASEVFTISIYKTGVQTAQRFFTATSDAMIEVDDVLNCVAGDTIKSTIDSTADTSYTIIGSSVTTFTTIERISGPSAIAASETVSFSANTSTTAATTSAPFIYTATDHNTHGAYSTSTGKFTAPVSGKYCFQAVVYCGATVVSATFYKNGSTVVGRCSPTTASNYIGTGTLTISLVAGDTIEMRPDVSATAVTGSTLNTFSGFRIGI